MSGCGSAIGAALAKDSVEALAPLDNAGPGMKVSRYFGICVATDKGVARCTGKEARGAIRSHRGLFFAVRRVGIRFRALQVMWCSFCLA
jgi:hypothetical protein